MEIMLPDDVPDEVTRLGEPVAMFRGGRLVMALCWFVGVLAILTGLALLGGLVVLMVDPPVRGAHIGGLFKLAILGLVALSGGVGMLRKAVRSRGLRVFVCADGLAHVHGENARVMRWDEINVVRRVVDAKNQELAITTPAQLILVDRNGRELVFNETVSGFRELRRLIEEHTLKHMLGPAREAFDRGAAIGFGEVSVSPAGLQCGRESLPWDLFEHAEVAKGRLVLYGGDGKKLFGRVGVSGVPNVHVLLALAEHARARSS